MLQPHEGTSGTVIRRYRTPPSVNASTPRGYIWNWRGRRPDPSRPRSFNPTRVHLELTACPAYGTPRPGFNPTRVHLEQGSSVCGAAGNAASTPRGYIWNLDPDPDIYDEAHALQPHEGTSGTFRLWTSRWLLEHASTPRGYIWNRHIRCRRSRSRTLQPHEGTSGTSSSSGSSPSMRKLQPHEGTSGTAPRPRSGRRGWCFNPTRVHLEPGRFRARRRRVRCFNPTRVHLEPVEIQYGWILYCASTPRGYIWNEQGVRPRHRHAPASTPRGYIWNRGRRRVEC